MAKEPVATEPWVFEQLTAIWKALNSTNSGVSGVNSGLGGLADAVNSKCITMVDMVPAEDTGGTPGVTSSGGRTPIKIRFWTGYEGSSNERSSTNSISVASTDHSHSLNLTSGELSILQGVKGDDTTPISLNHTHGLTGSMSDSGTLTLTWGDVNFSKATAEANKKITIDCSAWLKSKVESIWNNNVYVTCTADTKEGSSTTCKATATAEIKWSSLTKTKKDDDEWSCEASHGDYTRSDMSRAYE